jgi:hypothetical protein
MANEYLKDSTGRLLGVIKDSGDSKVLLNSTGRLLGKFDKRTTSTFDSTGRKIGTGNLLTMLLCKTK